MDIGFYMELLSRESTSGMEGPLADWLAVKLKTPANKVQKFDVGDGTTNLLFSWGDPQIVFCTHMDTVPPYIAPSSEEVTNPDGTTDVDFKGRGTCDAKGQIFSMWSACQRLEAMGRTGFGLLILTGEELCSLGAKSFRTAYDGGRVVIVGEPTDNCMVSASKGTKSFGLTFTGVPFHSGYPEYGRSAVDSFVSFVDALKGVWIPDDEVLGATTWNIGKLVSDNPQNILSEELTCKLYFRTTFSSDEFVRNLIPSLAHKFEGMTVRAFGGDTPLSYMTLDGFRTKTVAFGSDAPQLTNFEQKIICGPGSILVAHRPDEHLLLSDIKEAEDNYVRMFEILSK